MGAKQNNNFLTLELKSKQVRGENKIRNKPKQEKKKKKKGGVTLSAIPYLLLKLSASSADNCAPNITGLMPPAGCQGTRAQAWGANKFGHFLHYITLSVRRDGGVAWSAAGSGVSHQVSRSAVESCDFLTGGFQSIAPSPLSLSSPLETELRSDGEAATIKGSKSETWKHPFLFFIYYLGIFKI